MRSVRIVAVFMGSVVVCTLRVGNRGYRIKKEG